MSLEPLFQEIKDLKNKVTQIFIYGFGSYGRNLFQILKKQGIKVDGFVVTDRPDNIRYEIPIYKAEELLHKKVGYVLALNAKNLCEVEIYLKENHINFDYIINAGKYIEQFGEKRGTRSGSIEITTTIGCKVNCKHCPQGVLYKKYFERNKNRTNIMTLDTFKYCLDYFPKDYDISFGGMSEPFLNKAFVDMLKIASAQKRRISLYTTLVGMSKNDLEEILQLSFSFVVIHVADKYGYANIPLTEEYYENLDKIINATKADGKPFVNMCNAQEEPDNKVKKICKGKYEIFTEMTDRAGNLKNEGLICTQIKTGKLSCGNLGKDMNNNILLPDGSVVLCCMDYGLEHILGNIYENTFEEIMSSIEMQRVKEGMNGNETIDILCRKCSYARRV